MIFAAVNREEIITMARSRNIKPDFFLDEELCELKPLIRILFAGLWCLADREGRLECSFKKIRAQILPYDRIDIEAAIHILAKRFIKLYEVNGKQYIQIINFTKHQHPHNTEKASVIPPLDNRYLTVKQPLDNGDATSFIPIDLNTETLNTEIPVNGYSDLKPKSKPKNPDNDLIEKIRLAYPRKTSPKDARKAIQKAILEIEPEELLRRTVLYAESVSAKTTPQEFIKHAATWFNKGCYLEIDDDPNVWKTQYKQGFSQTQPTQKQEIFREQDHQDRSSYLKQYEEEQEEMQRQSNPEIPQGRTETGQGLKIVN